MIRPATLLSFILALALGFGLFKVKYAVQAEEQQLVTVEDQIVTDQDALHVLTAEWNQETQPDQLGAMAQRHLNLAPIKPAQLVAYDSLPLRVPAPVAAPSTPSAPSDAPAAVAEIAVPSSPTLVASAAGLTTPSDDRDGLDRMVDAIASESAAGHGGALPP